MRPSVSYLVFVSLLCLIMGTAYGEDNNALSNQTRIPIIEDTLEHKSVHLMDQLIPDLPLYNQSLSQAEAIQLALQNNLGIKVSQSETAIQKAMVKAAQAERWPILSLGALTFLRSNDNQTLMTPSVMMNTVDTVLFQDVNATARLPLFTGGRLRGRIQANQFALNASQSLLSQTAVDTAYQTREAYLKALYTQAEHLVHQSHINIEQTLLHIAEVRYRVGKGLRADVLRIQTELSDAQRMLNEEHRDLNIALFDLKAVMGMDLASELTLSDTLTYHPWQDGDVNDLIRYAIIKHPKVQEAYERMKEAQAQIKVAQSNYFPQVYGQATGNLRFPDRPPMMGNGVIGLLTAEVPVFSKARKAEVQKTQAILKQAQNEYRAAQLDIGKAIAQAWSGLEFANENVKLSDTAVSQAQEDLRLIQRRFDVGRAILVEVQDAALALRQAELNRNKAIFDYEMAQAALKQAVGIIDTIQTSSNTTNQQGGIGP